MATLSLRISIPDNNATKMMQFDPNISVYDACRIIRDKLTETSTLEQTRDYGLFLADEDTKKGVWLESGRSLDYYILRNGDLLEYKKKLRILRVRMLDGMLKTVLVDDSQLVANLMVVICTKIGITNHDEYSLVREFVEEQSENIKSGNFSTLTLKKKKEEKGDRDVKMDQLRKKLKTDDEVNWIDPSKTLREQGIDEVETVLLRRKFFFSDQNVDSRDPVQLSLLYVQARDAILDGTHPVTQSQACFFSGIQCQVQFGDYNEEKHKPGFLDLREFLPQSYFKVKGIERKVFVEYKKHNGLSEVDAKVLYTKTARSLNTYGVTFFLVKEKMKGKNKLVPRLLGVTKDSVLRLDEKTKEILKTWPLTTVRRWGASPNTFTLDFGDYSDQYYSVQTTEAEQILQIISGYIDIILRKQKAKDHFGIEGNEGSTMVEDSISPLKATIMQHETSPMGKGTVESVSVAIPAIIRSGVDGVKLYGTGYLDSAQYTTICGQVNIAHAPSVMQQTKFLTVTSEPQIALVSTLATAKEIIKNAETHLSCTSTIPDTNNDLASLRWREETVDIHKQNIGSQIAAMNAATAQMLTSTTGQQDTVDYAAVESAITTITTNLPELTKGVRMIAALIKDNSSGDKLLNAARKLCWAFSDLLRATETRSKEARHSLLNAASHIGEASHEVLFNIGEEGVLKKETQDVLLSLAKTVANTTAVLVLKAKNIAAICENSVTQNHVISAATYCALATSQLVACAKVVAPTLNTQACQNQLIYAVKEVTKAVQNLVEVCGMASTEINVYEDLSLAASNVTKTLNNFLNHIMLVTQDKLSEETTQEQAIEKIFFATDKLFSISGDAAEMVRQARIVGQATARLIQSIKGDADKRSNTEQQKKLLAAAKVLADATAKMVEAARQCASSPQDNQVQNYLRLAVKELREATATATTPAIRRSLMLKLQRYAKVAASSTTEYVAALARVDPYNANKITQKQWNEKCKCITELISELISGVKGASSEPDDSMMQLNLINASEKFCHSAESMIKVVKVVVPTISDYSLSLELDNNSQQLGTVLTDLRSASCHAREVCTGLQLDAAETSVNKLISELQDLSNSIILTIKPLPEENEESSLLKLITICQKLQFGTSQIVTAVRQQSDYYTGNAAAEYAAALKDLQSAIKGVLYTIENQDTKQTILTISINILCMSVKLIQEARTALHNEDYLSDVDALAAIEKKIFCHLDEYISSLPWQKSIDHTIHQIKEASHVLESDCRSEIQNFCELQNNLAAAADDLNNASSCVLSSIRFPIQLSTTLERFMSTFCSLIGTGVDLAGQTTNDTRLRIIASLKTVSTSAINLLLTIKSIAVEPVVPNRKNQLSLVGRSLTDAINCLINDCISETPGQIECDNSVRSIQSMIPLLENSCEPISDCSYFKCLNIVMEKSKSLGDGMTGIANHAKKSEHDLFSKAIKEVSYSICGLIEAAAQASYLAGVSDPLSLSAKPGLIDQKHFSRAVESIHLSCNVICNPAVSQQQILAAATSIAKHTSALCNACRLASSKTNNPIAKRHFVQSAKDVANSTASLVREIKVLDANFSDVNQVECIKATKPLLEAVHNLLTYASSSEFSSQPDKISTAAEGTQEPIIEAGKSIISSSCAMILTAKSLSVKCKDPPTWQLLANHSKSVSDSIKALVSSMREKAPGQKECDLAITKLTQKLQDLDTASLKILSQTLVSQNKNSFQGFIEQMNKTIYELRERIRFLQNVAKYEAENVGQVVLQIISFFDPLVDSGIGMISHLMKSKQQIFLLDQTKTVLECTLQLIFVTKECGGNPKATNLHAELDESVHSTKESLQELQSTFENISISNGTVTDLTDLIFRAIRQLQENVLTSQDSFDSFVTYQARIIEAAKDISRMALEILSISRMENTKLNSLVIKMSHKYTDLAQDTLRATIATFNEEMSTKLRIAVQELGNACLHLVEDACTCPIMSSDLEVYEKSSDYSKIIGEKVSLILAILQAGSRGTQACINAASTVSGIIGDLDTTIMFATAGTLHAENENETFADHRENILKTAKALVEDTKTLVAGAASSQEQLAVAAQNAVSTIVELAEVVKYGAASLGSENLEAQVMLINAIRDVTFALGDLIQATKAASGKLVNDPTMAQLKDSAKTILNLTEYYVPCIQHRRFTDSLKIVKVLYLPDKVMVTNVTSLLKTVKAVEDEHTRGTRALESTIEAIVQEIRNLSISEYSKGNILPEDLERCTKSISISTAKAVSAGNSCKQDDIIVAANMGRKSISDMLTICRVVSMEYVENVDTKKRILQTGHDVAMSYRELLQIVLQITSKSNDCKDLLLPISRKIANSVTELVAFAETIKVNNQMGSKDPTVIAENELLGAAASIDAAAKKLAGLRPRQLARECQEELNFDKMILEAAKSIATATSALIKAASAAQKELTAAGKVSKTPSMNSDDGQWSEGLVSAARMVAAATHSLVESANALVQGFSSEEQLISSAKQVAGSTAQLLVACKVKAELDSESTKRLQAAGNAVKKATDNLVRATQQAIQQEEERSLILNRRIVGGIAQEINARSEVLRIERELEEARGRLTAIRQAKYRHRIDAADGVNNDNNSCDLLLQLAGEDSHIQAFSTGTIKPKSLQNIESIKSNIENVSTKSNEFLNLEEITITNDTIKKDKDNDLHFLSEEDHKKMVACSTYG